ncbi:hypothetical protein WCN79_12755 [Xanthomonas axonopodis pv. vasculorum]|uniref:hypothetical protein n=1 Tax=Xanthomonas axonopodis TaxID=53413 RepID=UPI000A430E85|nr:hypothetical protein [Xanthomonas axonopodis]
MSGQWSAGTQSAVNAATEQLTTAFGGEKAIQAISRSLSQRWDALHEGDIDCAPELSLTSRRFEEVIARIGVMFKQGPAGQDRGLEALSDGQQYLFYFISRWRRRISIWSCCAPFQPPMQPPSRAQDRA